MDRTVVGKGHCDTSSLLHGASDGHRSLLHTQNKQSGMPSVRTDACRGREVQSIERRCEGSLFVDLSIAATRAKGRKGRRADGRIWNKTRSHEKTPCVGMANWPLIQTPELLLGGAEPMTWAAIY